MDIPSDLRYTSDHEWVRVVSTDGETPRVAVGITAYASDALGDVVFIELPEAGTLVSATVEMGELESTKSVSDLYAPVDGTIVAINEQLAAEPGAVNADPYGQGWLCEIECTDVSQVSALLDAGAYRELTGE